MRNIQTSIKKDNKIIENTQEIANEFNKLLNVGSNLTKEIDELGEKDGMDENLIQQNPHFIFIRSVS